MEFIVISADDELLAQIGQVLDDDCTVRQADAADAARGFMRPARPYVVLLDARGVTDLAAVIESVQSPHGTSVVVVLSPADEIAAVSRSVRGSATFAVLPIPIEPGQTLAVVEGASEESLARLTLITAPSLAPLVIAPPAPDPLAVAEAALTEAVAMAASATGGSVRKASPPIVVKPRSDATDSGKSRVLWIGLVLAAVAAGVVGWLVTRDNGSRTSKPTPSVAAAPVRTTPPARKPAAVAQNRTPIPSSATTATATVQDEVQDGSVDDLLDHARGAMLDRRYTDPQGDNALAYFRSVLAVQPENDEAREGLQRIGAVVEDRFQAALAQRKFDDAARTIAELRLIRPDDAALSQLSATLAGAQIAAALASGNTERAAQLLRQAADARTVPAADLARWRDELNRRAGDTRAQVYSNLVSARVREGKLLEPANDSARLYLSMLRKLPSDPKGLAATATEELQQAFLDKAQLAASRSQRADLDLWLNEARALGASPTRIAAILRSTAPPPAVRPVTPEAVRPPPVREERTVAAPVAPKPEPRAPSATEPKRTHYVAPDYPQEALQKKLRGEVQVRITVGSDGKVRDAVVANSSPPGVFDRAALAAVRRWRYQPGEVDGSAVEASLMTSIIFQPDNKRTP